MILHILFAQRKEIYNGEFGIEALACASEYDMDENPEYLLRKLEEYDRNKDFEAVRIVALKVNEDEILEILRPRLATLNAKVLG